MSLVEDILAHGSFGRVGWNIRKRNVDDLEGNSIGGVLSDVSVLIDAMDMLHLLLQFFAKVRHHVCCEN